MHDFQDETPLEKIWYRDLMPEVRSYFCISLRYN